MMSTPEPSDTGEWFKNDDTSSCRVERPRDPEPTVPADLANHTRYRIVEKVGSGGMGTVYRAEHRLMGRTVALKVINPHLVGDAGMVERFEKEVRTAARLSHPNIVAAYDAGRAGNTHFLVIEFGEGMNL